MRVTTGIIWFVGIVCLGHLFSGPIAVYAGVAVISVHLYHAVFPRRGNNVATEEKSTPATSHVHDRGNASVRSGREPIPGLWARTTRPFHVAGAKVTVRIGLAKRPAIPPLAECSKVVSEREFSRISGE